MPRSECSFDRERSQRERDENATVADEHVVERTSIGTVEQVDSRRASIRAIARSLSDESERAACLAPNARPSITTTAEVDSQARIERAIGGKTRGRCS